MRVRMNFAMSGTRNGKAWPAPGEEVNLPADEARELCESGMATPVRSDDDSVEKRVSDAAKKQKGKS